MNEQNLAYLKDSLKYMGFGEPLQAELEKNIQQRFPEFILKLDTEINKTSFSAALYFKRGETSNMYFFNQWQASLKNEGGKREQTFYINKGQGVTLKEGFNLLEGRAVHKELSNQQGQKYNAWLQLDFNERDEKGGYKIRQYHQNYGYDLEKTLSQYPIKELRVEGQRELLLRSLSKGNQQAVTMEVAGKEHRMTLEANPKFKTLLVNGKDIRQAYEQLQKQVLQQAPQQKQEIKQSVKQEVKQRQQQTIEGSGAGPGKRGKRQTLKNKIS